MQNQNRTLVPDQDIVASQAQALKQEIKAKLAEPGQGLTIDLKQVEMIDSSGLGILIATHNSLQQEGYTLALKNVSRDLMHLLQTMRLDKHFQVEPENSGANDG